MGSIDAALSRTTGRDGSDEAPRAYRTRPMVGNIASPGRGQGCLGPGRDGDDRDDVHGLVADSECGDPRVDTIPRHAAASPVPVGARDVRARVLRDPVASRVLAAQVCQTTSETSTANGPTDRGT
ncbi:hypothetical protein [Nannocystis sp. SCPEA4]|uniref:hypothetical protein n=1 Tax=Nannocystis sp. SCPEA4 TaxID=2996787 RepID=UPI0022722820|nr:hypothetical protein [Nannocystis sp. SCPEA4]MCY1059926.1 hypothetical protein [Nannocystis sp. SCPEA4]